MTVLDFIGNTPMVKIEGIYVKLENMNPSGSTKDRIAKYIIEKAEDAGKLKPGYKVVEATSGNSGISFSMVCAAKGYQMVVVMPEGLTKERKEIMRKYGAKVIETPENESIEGAVEKELKLEKEIDYYPVKQFENVWNIEAHEKTLGKEIKDELGQVDAFVAGVGTGGTLIGVGKSLDTRLYAVEPEESPVISGGDPGEHDIEGIGDGFVPKIYKNNEDMVEDVIIISSEDAINEANRIAKEHGILVGPSSGANLLAAKSLKDKYDTIVTVFPDSGDRYLSEFAFI